MKKISKTKMILEAVVVIGIALALVMPGAATLSEDKTLDFKNSPTKKILTRDGGWVEQSSDFWEPNRGIHYMHAVDENIVWAVSYDGSGSNLPVQEYTKTVNGGEEWNADVIDTAPDDGDTAMIFALDENTAWVPIHSGDPQGIWKTSDGGDTWVRQDTANFSGSGAFPNCVHFWNENDGWCMGDQVDGYYEMYTTSDGGNNWARVPEENIPEPLSSIEYGVVGYYDVVGDTVWFGTQDATMGGRVFKSEDKGLHWNASDVIFDPGSYVDIRFKDENNGLAMDKNFEVPFLAETSDGGETWDILEYSGVCYGADIDYVPGTDNMYVSTGVNYNSIYGASYSFDGGHNWVIWPEMENIQLFGTTWVEGITGWAGTFAIDDETGGVWKYTVPDDPVPDLYCMGSLSWADVSPGSTVTSNFKVLNIGDPMSLLDWEVTEWPEWGTWTFTPTSDEDLTPEYGQFIVEVEVIAPDEKNEEFTGEVKVVNQEDTNDVCVIDVSLATPKNKPYNIFSPFLRFLELHPNLFPVLRQLIGL